MFTVKNQFFPIKLVLSTCRVTSLEQLSVAEFSGEYANPKVYENGHKNVLAIWFHLVQLNKYETASNFIQLTRNLTSDCLLI